MIRRYDNGKSESLSVWTPLSLALRSDTVSSLNTITTATFSYIHLYNLYTSNTSTPNTSAVAQIKETRGF